MVYTGLLLVKCSVIMVIIVMEEDIMEDIMVVTTEDIMEEVTEVGITHVLLLHLLVDLGHSVT